MRRSVQISGYPVRSSASRSGRYHHVRMVDPGEFTRIRTKTLSDKKGIKARIGVHASRGLRGGRTEVQSYLFDAGMYAPRDVVRWIESHSEFIPVLVEWSQGQAGQRRHAVAPRARLRGRSRRAVSNPGHGYGMPVRSNPMLAIVGNPPERDVHPLAYEARDRYREDIEAGHTSAAEYWRGQAGAYFSGNPGRGCPECGQANEYSGLCESCAWKRAHGKAPVAGSAGKKKIKGRKVAKEKGGHRKNPHEQRKQKPRTKRVSLEEARETFHGLDEAVARYERFHGQKPKDVEIYYLPNGEGQERVENVHVALHRTIETPYVVPWPSNKKGSVWLHEHPKGEDAPLEVLDPKTGTTRKIGGVYVVDKWWES